MLCLSVHEENVHGQNVFQMNSKWIMEHLFDKRMSERGYPSILIPLHDRGRSLDNKIVLFEGNGNCRIFSKQNPNEL